MMATSMICVMHISSSAVFDCFSMASFEEEEAGEEEEEEEAQQHRAV